MARVTRDRPFSSDSESSLTPAGRALFVSGSLRPGSEALSFSLYLPVRVGRATDHAMMMTHRHCVMITVMRPLSLS